MSLDRYGAAVMRAGRLHEGSEPDRRALPAFSVPLQRFQSKKPNISP